MDFDLQSPQPSTLNTSGVSSSEPGLKEAALHAGVAKTPPAKGDSPDSLGTISEPLPLPTTAPAVLGVTAVPQLCVKVGVGTPDPVTAAPSQSSTDVPAWTKPVLPIRSSSHPTEDMLGSVMPKYLEYQLPEVGHLKAASSRTTSVMELELMESKAAMLEKKAAIDAEQAEIEFQLAAARQRALDARKTSMEADEQRHAALEARAALSQRSRTSRYPSEGVQTPKENPEEFFIGTPSLDQSAAVLTRESLEQHNQAGDSSPAPAGPVRAVLTPRSAPYDRPPVLPVARSSRTAPPSPTCADEELREKLLNRLEKQGERAAATSEAGAASEAE